MRLPRVFAGRRVRKPEYAASNIVVDGTGRGATGSEEKGKEYKKEPVVPVVADGKVDKEGIGLFLKRLRICSVFQKRSVGFRTIG